MNKFIIIGNLTRDPEMADRNDLACCTFTVAVNRRVRAGAHPEADYVRVTTWSGLAETCYNNLRKGRKVAVTGTVKAYAWIDQNGEARGRLEVNAQEVEFCDSRKAQAEDDAPPASGDGFQEVDDDEPPFS